MKNTKAIILVLLFLIISASTASAYSLYNLNSSNWWGGAVLTNGVINPNQLSIENDLAIPGYVGRWEKGLKDWNGTNNNNATSALTTPWGNADAYFDGDDYLTLANSAALSPESGTYTVVTKFRSTTNLGATAWLYSDYGVVTNNLVLVAFDLDEKAIGYIRDGAGTTISVTTSGSVFDGANKTLVLSKENGTGLSLYINKTLIGSSNDGALGAISTSAGSTPFIGTNQLGALPFTGYLSYLVIYKGTGFTWGNVNTTNDERYAKSTYVTTNYDSGVNNRITEVTVNFTSIPSGSNYTIWYANNGTEDYAQLGGTLTANTTQTISGTTYNNTKFQIRMVSDGTVTPQLHDVDVKYSAVNPIALTSWNNNYTNNDTLNLSVPRLTNISFNVGFNQTATTCTWSGATQMNCSENSYAYKKFTTVGMNYVNVTGFNESGSTDTKSWSINVTGSSTWDKEKPIYINNIGNPILTDFPININLTYDDDMNTDFSDIRVINRTTGLDIPYWIEEQVNESYANVWFNASYIPAGVWDNTSYAVKYGNNTATSSTGNGEDTFQFFDDFSINQVEVYAGWTAVTDENNAAVKIGDKTIIGYQSVDLDETGMIIYNHSSGTFSQQQVVDLVDASDHFSTIFQETTNYLLTFGTKYNTDLKVYRYNKTTISYIDEVYVDSTGEMVFPHPVMLDSGRLYIFYRDPDGRTWYYKYTDDEGATWSSRVEVLDTLTYPASAPLSYIQLDTDGSKIFMTLTTADSSAPLTHYSLWFMQMLANGSWAKDDGTLITLPTHPDSMSRPIDKPAHGLQTIYSSPNLYAYYHNITTTTNWTYNRLTWNGTGWSDEIITWDWSGGMKPPAINYGLGLTVSQANPDLVYLIQNVSSVWELQKWEKSGGAWSKTEDITSGSTKSSMRPLSVRNGTGDMDVVWLTIAGHYTAWNDMDEINLGSRVLQEAKGKLSKWSTPSAGINNNDNSTLNLTLSTSMVYLDDLYTDYSFNPDNTSIEMRTKQIGATDDSIVSIGYRGNATAAYTTYHTYSTTRAYDLSVQSIFSDITYGAVTGYNTLYPQGEYHRFRFQNNGTTLRITDKDNTSRELSSTDSTFNDITSANVGFGLWGAAGTFDVDYIFVRKITSTEPATQMGEDTPDSITNPQTTTGNFYINNTWTDPVDADFDHVKFAYENGTSLEQNVSAGQQYLELIWPPHYEQNISAQTVNTAGNINETLVWFNATIPNNAPVQSPILSRLVVAGDWLNLTISSTDLDDDALTYGTNCASGTLNTTTGAFVWNTTTADIGSFSCYFNSSDAYGGVGNETISINVQTPTTPWTVGEDGEPWTGNSEFANVTKDNQGSNIVVGFDYSTFNDNTITSWNPYTGSGGNVSVQDGKARINSSTSGARNAEIYKGFTFPTIFNVSAKLNISISDAAFAYYFFLRDDCDCGNDSVSKTPVYTGFRNPLNYSWYTGTAWNDVFVPSVNTDYTLMYGLNQTSQKFDIYKDGTYQEQGSWNTAGGTAIDNVSFVTHQIIGNLFVDDVRLWNTTQGNVTVWRDSGDGNELTGFDVNATTLSTLNYSVYYRQNATGDYVQLGAAQTGNNSYLLPTEYQNIDVIIQLIGNETATPELIAVTFFSERIVTPPDPVQLSSFVSNDFVNWSWVEGYDVNGNTTDSYRILHNGTWTNDTTVLYFNATVGIGNWSNISLYAWNNSGRLSDAVSGSILNSLDVTVPAVSCSVTGLSVNCSWVKEADMDLFEIEVYED